MSTVLEAPGSSVPNNRGAVAWFDSALDAFSAAERAAGAIEEHYSIGSLHVCLRFAGRALVGPMTEALAHLTAPTDPKPDVTIFLFDGATGGAPPKPRWGPEAYGARGEIEGFNVDPIRTVYDAGDHILRVADVSGRCGVFWIRDPASVPYYERGAPLRTLFHWLLGAQGRQLVHAAAVGTAAGAALLAGKGGSGKSTSALTCIGSGLLFGGDDYVLLAPGQRGTIVHSLYSAAKLHAEQAERFPQLKALVENADRLATEKALYLLARRFPEALLPAVPARAVLLPKVVGGIHTRVTAATPSAALAALAPTTMFQLPGDAARSFRMLSNFVRETPAYWLELGTDLSEIPEAIARILQE